VRLQFDRGTILILDPPDGISLADLPGVLWDSRVSAHRCPAHLHARLRAALDARGVRYTDSCPAAGQPPPPAHVELRPYQEAALTAWELAGRRGVVVLPTGSGKTRVALAAIARVGRPALCLVPTRVLLDQWARAIAETLSLDAGRYGDGEQFLGPVTVATFESAWRHMAELGQRFELLVVDEAHHFGAGLRDEALEMSLAPHRLGLTATPPRDRPGDRLDELVGPVIYELSVSQLAGQFLAPFDAVLLHVDLAPDERKEYESLDRTWQDVLAQFHRFRPGATWEQFVREAGRTDEGRRAIAAWRRSRTLLAFPRAKRSALGGLLARHADDRTLVFTGDNDTAYRVAREHLVMPITCDIKRRERERALARFRDGTLRALVSAQVLNEGIDVPDADVGIIVAGRGGEREHVQRIGRLLRPRPGKRATIYELVVRHTREVRIAHRRRRALAS
jgi:superfamily II DNA or RNA helicase